MSALPILNLTKNGAKLKSVPVDGTIDIGRGEGCVIRLDDRAVSRRHATISPGSNGQVSVRKESDVGSLMVNGVEGTEFVASPGDVIEIGEYRLRLEAGASESKNSSVARPSRPEPATGVLPVPELVAAPIEAPSAAPLSFDLMQDPVAPERTSRLVTMDGIPAPVEESPLQSLTGSIGEASPDATSFISPLDIPPSEAATGPVVDEGSVSGLSINVEEDAPTRIVDASRVSARLKIEAYGDEPEREIEITKDETFIGRGSDCDLIIDDKKISRRNTLLLRKGMSFLLKDLGSSNGTYLNGQRIEQSSLTSDDEIRIGKARIRFIAESAGYEEKAKNFLELVPEVAPDLDPTPAQAEPPAAAPYVPPPSFEPQPADQASIAGLAGMGAKGGKRSLLSRYRELNKRQQIIYGISMLALIWFLLDESPSEKPAAKPKPAPSTQPANAEGPNVAFEALTPANKKYVETQHALAFDHYRNREYDKCLFELAKIFVLVNNYKDSRDIERYAKEGKRKLEQLEEERKRREEEARLKSRIIQLVEETRKLMEAKSYLQAKELFAEILALDPDNTDIAGWRKEIEHFEEQRAAKAQQKRVQDELNEQGLEIFNQGVSLRKAGKLYPAISRLDRIAGIGVTDEKLLARTRVQIKQIREEIDAARGPLLAEGKAAEANGDLGIAFKRYQAAAEIDPKHPDGPAGMERVRKVLQERCKLIYIEAVLAESYSDFVLAKRKYQQLLETAPSDDIYYQRAKRKLAGYFINDEEPKP